MSDVLVSVALLAVIVAAIIGVLFVGLFVSWWAGQEPIDQGEWRNGEWHPTKR